jgi:hypothetical protein
VPAGHAPFAVFNKTGNQVVRLLLLSPLHRLVSGRLALITVTGRKSGRRFTFPVAYRQEGGVVKVHVVWPERKLWWRNLRGAGAPVTLRLRGATRGGHAEAREDQSGETWVHVRLDQAGA